MLYLVSLFHILTKYTFWNTFFWKIEAERYDHLVLCFLLLVVEASEFIHTGHFTPGAPRLLSRGQAWLPGIQGPPLRRGTPLTSQRNASLWGSIGPRGNQRQEIVHTLHIVGTITPVVSPAPYGWAGENGVVSPVSIHLNTAYIVRCGLLR